MHSISVLLLAASAALALGVSAFVTEAGAPLASRGLVPCNAWTGKTIGLSSRHTAFSPAYRTISVPANNHTADTIRDIGHSAIEIGHVAGAMALGCPALESTEETAVGVGILCTLAAAAVSRPDQVAIQRVYKDFEPD